MVDSKNIVFSLNEHAFPSIHGDRWLSWIVEHEIRFMIILH